MKILVVGLITRQQQLVRQACTDLPNVQLEFIDCTGRRPPARLPNVDVCIRTRFLPHKWSQKMLQELGPRKTHTMLHNGLGSIVSAIKEAAGAR